MLRTVRETQSDRTFPSSLWRRLYHQQATWVTFGTTRQGQLGPYYLLLQAQGQSLDEESLQTLIAETESFINLQPLDFESVNDEHSLQTISPSKLLLKQNEVVIPPPGRVSSNGRIWGDPQHHYPKNCLVPMSPPLNVLAQCQFCNFNSFWPFYPNCPPHHQLTPFGKPCLWYLKKQIYIAKTI